MAKGKKNKVFIEPAKIRPVPMTAQAYQICLELARSHYENFPVASILIPKKLRPHIAAVYAFARTADDFADEVEHEGQRLEKLFQWEYQLKSIDQVQPQNPIFVALHQTIKQFQLPRSLFLDLLTAFKMDVTVNRYQTFEDVLGYCQYSANPVGRIILHLMGYLDEKLLRASDAICTGLQLTNFWQDVFIDLAKDRIYLPQEDLIRFGYTYEELKQKKLSPTLRRLLLFQVERTREIFQHGVPLLEALPGRLGLEIKLTWLGGMTILDKIWATRGDVLHQRPQLSKIDFPRLLIKALVMKGRPQGWLR